MPLAADEHQSGHARIAVSLACDLRRSHSLPSRPSRSWSGSQDLRDGIEPGALVVRFDLRGVLVVSPSTNSDFTSEASYPRTEFLGWSSVNSSSPSLSTRLVSFPSWARRADQGRHFGGGRLVVPRRTDHLWRKGQEVLVQPSAIDRRRIDQRREPSDRLLTPPELAAREPCPSEEEDEQRVAKPRGSAEADTRRPAWRLRAPQARP